MLLVLVRQGLPASGFSYMLNKIVPNCLFCVNTFASLKDLTLCLHYGVFSGCEQWIRVSLSGFYCLRMGVFSI